MIEVRETAHGSRHTAHGTRHTVAPKLGTKKMRNSIRTQLSVFHRLFTDATCRGNPGPSGGGAVLLSPDGSVVATSTVTLGMLTSNSAEYNACLHGLDLARKHNVKRVIVLSDSRLLVQQMRGMWRVAHPGLRLLHSRAREAAAAFELCRFAHIPRIHNMEADRLANAALDELSPIAFSSTP